MTPRPGTLGATTVRRLGVTAALLLVGLVGSGCREAPGPSASSSASTTPTAGDQSSAHTAREPRRPSEGACFRLSYDQALAPTSRRRPVPCDRDHTSTTYLVGELDTVVEGHLLAVDAAQVQAGVARTCPARLADFLGATPVQLRLSTLRAVWFSPTLAQADRGANWFRCDAIALGGDDRLADLGPRLRGALASPAGRDRYGICGTSQPGRADFEQVICSSPHAWRAISTYDLAGEDYPGQAAIRAAAQDPCQAAAKARASDPLDYQWGFDWPTQRQWAAGQHYGLCWAPD